MRNIDDRQIQVRKNIHLDIPDRVNAEKKQSHYNYQDRDRFSKRTFNQAHKESFRWSMVILLMLGYALLKLFHKQVEVAAGGCFQEQGLPDIIIGYVSVCFSTVQRIESLRDIDNIGQSITV